MADTRHGYHIPGTVITEPRPPRARCGGPKLCKRCALDVGRHHREHLEEEHEKLIQEGK